LPIFLVQLVLLSQTLLTHQQRNRLATLLRAKHPEANIHTRSILLGIAGTIYEQYTISQLHQLRRPGEPYSKVPSPRCKELQYKTYTPHGAPDKQHYKDPKGRTRAISPHLPAAPKGPTQSGGHTFHPPGRAIPGTSEEGLDEANDGEGRRAGEAAPFRRTWCRAERRE
jgi:hypothetical protein